MEDASSTFSAHRPTVTAEAVATAPSALGDQAPLTDRRASTVLPSGAVPEQQPVPAARTAGSPRRVSFDGGGIGGDAAGAEPGATAAPGQATAQGAAASAAAGSPHAPAPARSASPLLGRTGAGGGGALLPQRSAWSEGGAAARPALFGGAAPAAGSELSPEASWDLDVAGCLASSASAPRPSIDPSVGSLSRKALRQAEALREKFGLPEGETLVADYLCALRKRLLIQGRLYVFDAHLCFSSSLFGYHKQVVVPLAEITGVKKKKNVGFPNSISVECGPARYFFTSFLARQDAYRSITSLWAQCSEAGREAAAAEAARKAAKAAARGGSPSPAAAGAAGAEPPCSPRGPVAASVKLGRAMGRVATALVSRESGGAGSPEPAPGVTPKVAEGDSARKRGGGSSDEESEATMSTPASPEIRPASAAGAPARGAPPPPPPELGPSASFSFESAPTLIGGLPEFEAVTDLQAQADWAQSFCGASEPAPPVEDGMRRMLEFDLPCSPQDFWLRFLSSASAFFHRFHESRGDTNITLSEWQRHQVVGMVRDLQFVTKVKSPLGTNKALCHQTQRYSVYAGCHLVLDTRQVHSEIPYGDAFSVETRWDVSPCGGGGGGSGSSHVVLHVKVPFNKEKVSAFVRKIIEKGVTDSTLESFNMWKEMASEQLEEQPGSASDALRTAQRQISLSRPRTAEEWEGLLSKVDPQFRDMVRSTLLSGDVVPRPRHARSGSASHARAGSVSHGRSGGVAHHARTGSIGRGVAVARSPLAGARLQHAGSGRSEGGSRELSRRPSRELAPGGALPARSASQQSLSAVLEDAATGLGGDPAPVLLARRRRAALGGAPPPNQSAPGALARARSASGALLGSATQAARGLLAAAAARSGAALLALAVLAILGLQLAILREFQLARHERSALAFGALGSRGVGPRGADGGGDGGDGAPADAAAALRLLRQVEQGAGAWWAQLQTLLARSQTQLEVMALRAGRLADGLERTLTGGEGGSSCGAAGG